MVVSPFVPDHKNLSKILIPIPFGSPFCVKGASLLLFLLLLLVFTVQSLSLSSYSLSIDNNNKSPKTKIPIVNDEDDDNNNNSHKRAAEKTMKVHPLPKKRNITIQFERNPQGLSLGGSHSHKKLRRLPHIFSRVLELPFRSDADVEVEESHDCFRFTVETENIGDVRAHTIEIHPGVIKIVVRTNGQVEISTLDELELDMWRFRLPETTRPELASAVFMDGELIVTVPKGGEGGAAAQGNGDDEEVVWGDGGAGGGGFRGMGNNKNNNGNTNSNRLVLVQ